MRGATKMLMISSRSGGNREHEREPRQEPRNYGEMRGYGEMRQYEPEMNRYTEARGYGELEYNGGGSGGGARGTGGGDMEMRRYNRRYRNGRFRPRSELEMREPEYREPRQIGFRGEYEPEMYMHGSGGSGGGKMQRGGASGGMNDTMDRWTAEEWVKGMKNADGTRGQHWSMDQTKQIMEKRQIDCDPTEFWVTMNMLYSDYSKVVKQHGITSVDFYADMAKAFLDDEDAVDGKLMSYYEYIVE